jgi:hypothetical protein
MAKISTYPVDGTPSLGDKLIGSDVNDNFATKNYTISDIISLANLGNYVPYVGAAYDVDLGSKKLFVQQINTNVNGLFISHDSTSGVDGLSLDYNTGTYTIGNTLGVYITLVDSASLIDFGASASFLINGSEGTSGDLLQSNGPGVSPSWITPTVPTLDQVLNSGNSSLNDAGVGTLNLYDISNSYYNYILSDDDGFGFYLHATTNPLFRVDDGGMVLRSTYGIFTLLNTSLTGNRTVSFPNANGTLVLSVNGTAPNAAGDITLPLSGGWGLTGNSGTTPGTNFIGTTDAQDLIFKTNSTERLKIIEASGNMLFTSPLLSITGYPATAIEMYPAVGNRGAKLGHDAVNGGYLTLGNDSGPSGLTGLIRSSNITNNRIYDIPNASGTFALSVNGVAADSTGNVTTSGYTGSIVVGAQTLNFTNGILTSVV